MNILSNNALKISTKILKPKFKKSQFDCVSTNWAVSDDGMLFDPCDWINDPDLRDTVCFDDQFWKD